MMTYLKNLTYKQKMGLLFEANLLLTGLIEVFLMPPSPLSREDKQCITGIHMHLRLMVEDLLAEREFREIREHYYCPFDMLWRLEPFALVGWVTWQRQLVDQFSKKLAEPYTRAGSPGCPKGRPYGSLLRDLRRWLEIFTGTPPRNDRDLLLKVEASARRLKHRKEAHVPEDDVKSEEVVSPEEETQVAEHGYRCNDFLHIPGTVTEKGNVVVLNRKQAIVKDREFPLLLRLLAELKKGHGGWVSVYDLYDEGLVNDPGRYHPYSNLRGALEAFLLGHSGLDFIESDKIRKKRYRVSIPPGRVSYDREKLLTHPKGDVRRIAKLLPHSKRPKK